MRRHGLVLGVILLLAVLPLFAQEAKKAETSELSLEQLLDVSIVTASKFAQSSGKAPATVAVIGKSEIRERNYRSLLDVLRDLPEFKIDYRSDAEWYNTVTVRGVRGQEKFVILLDGVRISGPTNETLPILENYPVNLAEQIEVVYGPSSALYGADAVLGVVNIITRKPDGHGEAAVQLGDNDLRFGQFFGGVTLPNNGYITVAGQTFEDDQPNLAKDYPDYRNFASHKENRFNSIFGPIRSSDPFNPSASQPIRAKSLFAGLRLQDFAFSFFQMSSRLSSSSVYNPDNAIYNDDVFLRHRLTVASGNHSANIGKWSLGTTVTGSRYDLDPHSNFRDVFTGLARGFKYAQSQSFRFEEQVVYTMSKRTTLVGGGSYESDQATPWSTDLDQPVARGGPIRGKILGTPLDADFFSLKYTTKGAYLQGQFSISPALTATVGARYDTSSRYQSTFNPRAGIVWDAGRAGTVKMLYGSAFLAPSPYAAYAHFGSFFSTDGGKSYQSFFWRLPNPGLEPIHAKTLEVTDRISLGPSFSVRAGAYYSRYRNLFALVNDATTTHLYNGMYKGFPVATIEVRANQGTEDIHGGTLQLDYVHTFAVDQAIVGNVAYSYVTGKIDPLENGKKYEIGGIAPSTFRVGADVQLGKWSVSPHLLVSGEQRLESLNPATNKRYTIGGYSLLTIPVRYKLRDNMDVTLTMTNALDQHYRNVSEGSGPGLNAEFDGTPQDPRRVAVGVAYRF